MSNLTPFILFILGVAFYNIQTRQTEIIKFKVGLLIEVFNLVGKLRDMCSTIAFPLTVGGDHREEIMGGLAEVQNSLQAKVNQMVLIDKNIYSEAEKVLKASRLMVSYYILHKGLMLKSGGAEMADREKYYNQWTELCPAIIESSYGKIVILVGNYLEETTFSYYTKKIKGFFKTK